MFVPRSVSLYTITDFAEIQSEALPAKPGNLKKIEDLSDRPNTP